MLDTILGFVSRPLTAVIERLVPDKNLQKQIEHEFGLEVLKQSGDVVKQFNQRLIAEIKNPSFLRDAVRPLITYASFGLYAYIKVVTVWVATKVYLPLINHALIGKPEAVYERLHHIKSLLHDFTAAVFTEFDFYLLLTVFTFWFGGKLIERFAEKATGGGGIRSLLFGSKRPG
jgi:hypothetical protein